MYDSGANGGASLLYPSMKLTRLLPALPLVLFACEAPTTTPPSGRAVTPTEVAALTARARTELAPRMTEALHALDTSQFFADVELDFTALPSGSELSDGARDVMDELFSDAAIESSGPSEITYRARPQALCDGDSDCIRALTTHPVRFVVTSPLVDHLHIAIDVGARRLRAVQLDLGPDRIAVDLDLALARSVVLEFGGDLGLDRALVPSDVGGLVHLEATAHSFALATSGNAHIAGSLQGAPYRFALGDSQASLDFDEVAHTVIGELALGAIAADFPFAWIGHRTECDEVTGDCVNVDAEGQLQYALAGFTARVHLASDDDMLVLDDLGLGGAPLTASLDGVRQVSFDMNAARGRTVDVSLRYLRQELEIAVSPELEAVLELSMAAIAQKVEIAAWAVSDSVRLRFDGATSPTLRVSPEGGFARVVSGSLSLISNTQTLSASTDECIAPREDVADDAHFVEALMSYPCE